MLLIKHESRRRHNRPSDRNLVASGKLHRVSADRRTQDVSLAFRFFRQICLTGGRITVNGWSTENKQTNKQSNRQNRQTNSKKNRINERMSNNRK